MLAAELMGGDGDMYKVMIVEDEMLVRIGLKNSVDWSKFGMEVTADFPDGQAAWDYYKREKPDLVITDIRMPKMDGMELIANIRGQDKDTRVVVLSCLEEFDLARKAMSLGVSSYILKLTMTEEEIESVLSAVREELELRKGQLISKDEDAITSTNMELMKEKMFKDFLFYNIFSAEEFGSFAAQYGLRLSPSRLVFCLMEVDSYSRLKDKFRDNQGHLIKMTLLNILGEIMIAHKRGEAMHLEEKRYAIVFDFGDVTSEQAINQEVHAILSRVKEVIQTYFNGSVSFGISGVRGGYQLLPKLYAEANKALENKFFLGPGHMLKAGQAVSMNAIRTRLESLRAYPAFRSLLSPTKLKEYDEYIDELAKENAGDRRTIEVMLFQLAQWVSTNLYDHHQNEKTLLVTMTENLEDCDTLPDMLDQVTSYIEEVTEQAHNRLQMSDEIAKAIQFIKQNYTDNISLQIVADHVGLSFSYLSNLFKRELQISFIDYLNRYRIERAKELLSSSQLKSYDIAVQVGFSPEYTYFSKVFKKVTGLNPNEYRRKMLSGTEDEP